MFVEDLIHGVTTRACIFASIHVPATMLLMDKLEASGLITYVGKVNMDRNCPDNLRECTEDSLQSTREWLTQTARRYRRTKPIITPRFIPACSDALLAALGSLAREYQIPVQSHLSENPDEMNWVKELCPWAVSYGHAYDRWGLLGNPTPAIMAHCVWSSEEERALLKQNQVYIAHSPASNANLSSGIAPVKSCLQQGLRVGLATDLAAGESTSVLRAMSQAIALSKIRWRYVDPGTVPLTIKEVFYLGTLGGGAFFGKVGSFAPGYEFDAVVIDDSPLTHPQSLSLRQRLERVIYLSEHCPVTHKFIRGKQIF